MNSLLIIEKLTLKLRVGFKMTFIRVLSETVYKKHSYLRVSLKPALKENALLITSCTE